jgi:hypothetical protein
MKMPSTCVLEWLDEDGNVLTTVAGVNVELNYGVLSGSDATGLDHTQQTRSLHVILEIRI